MKNQIIQVRDFMLCAGQPCPEFPDIPSPDVQWLRIKLHKEEAVTELHDAFTNHDLLEVFDSICDSLVVVFGTAIACGISPEKVEAGFAEVMRSNMTKFIDGHKGPDGKWIKGPSFDPPNLMNIL